MKSKELFSNPQPKYKPRKIVHKLCDDVDGQLDTLCSEHYGGVVTNVPAQGGFTSSKENVSSFAEALKKIKERDLPYWIYDEDGYPSGRAGGLALDGHPELASKGMFMYKRYAFSDTTAKYHLPDEADKIVYAVKFPFGGRGEGGRIDFSRPTRISFDEKYLECELRDHETLYVFSVKTTHEGTHGMHNAFSQMQNINIMDKRAVRRFIDVAYEPIATVPGAYEGAEGVFTDEPSLFTVYNARDYVYEYALVPYCDEIFDAYFSKYGEALYDKLPLLFEGGREAYPVRERFYSLCGELVADAYSGQLNEWCQSHGTRFSGHYLGEDLMTAHVQYYGDLSRVLLGSGYPGFDILTCIPEHLPYINQKMPEMVSRKKGWSGLMTELCPFDRIEEFNKAPLENMKYTGAVCFMHGARIANSYYQPKMLSTARSFNDYLGRIGYMLDGMIPDTGLFVYYPLEEIKAKLIPSHSRMSRDVGINTHQNLAEPLRALIDSGLNPLLADSDDVKKPCEDLLKGQPPQISSLEVRTIVIPECELIYTDTARALRTLSDGGVRVLFVGAMPKLALGDGAVKEISDGEFSNAAIVSLHELTSVILREDEPFSVINGAKIIKSKFKPSPYLKYTDITSRPSEEPLYMLVNAERDEAILTVNSTSHLELWNPSDGNITVLDPRSRFVIPPTSAIFIRTIKN